MFEYPTKEERESELPPHSLETSPENSGSPIFNNRSEVIAIHNAGLPGGESLDVGIRADEIRMFLKSLYVGVNLGTHVNAKRISGPASCSVCAP